MRALNIYGEIKGIKYKPFLCKTLNHYDINELEKAMSKRANFILRLEKMVMK